MIVFIFIILSAILESSITTLPLTFLIVFFLSVALRNSTIFPIAFFSGLFLDFLILGNVGFSSLYFVSFSFLVLLYQNKFEIDTPYFIILFSFLGSFFYLLLRGSDFSFFQALVASFITIFSYQTYKIMSSEKTRKAY